MKKNKKFTPKSRKKRIGGKKKTGSKNSGLDDKVIKYLNTKVRSGVRPDILHKHLLKKYTEEKINASITRLLNKKRIEFTENEKIKIVRFMPSTEKFLTGKLDVASSGVGYVMVEGLEKDIFIRRKDLNSAMNGDIVSIEVTKFSKSKPEGLVLDVVERSQTEFLGRFEKSTNFAFVIPLNKAIKFDIYVPESLYNGAEDGDFVRARVKTWKDKGKNPIGKISEILKDFSPNELEMQNILLENGFRLKFPYGYEKELEQLSTRISKKDYEKRLDYTEVATFTIDPLDAKDFDDALSILSLENGNTEIGVHIADVSHYVRPGMMLDNEARYRTTSVYLPDRVLPMLPEKISNELCSLRPEEEKLAFSVLFEFNDKLEVVSYRFAKTVIFSNRRFVYEEVQEILDGKDGDFKEELLYMNKVAHHLREKRYKNGSLMFHSDEVRFKLDEYAKPVEVYVKETLDANLLVEDFMLLANVTVAKYLSKLKIVKDVKQPSVYRVHDKPSIEKLQTLASIAKRFGIDLKFEGKEQTRGTLESLLQQIERKPELSVLGKLAIRSMAKAEYTTKNLGHFGLAFDFYTHFTSPIRRYPDVLIHRLLASRTTKEKYFFEKEELEELLQHCSTMEKKAQKCERSATKYKQVEYMQQYVGKEFEGIISGVMQKGFFVEIIENKCEGMVPTYQLDEEFVYEEDMMRLKGLSSGVVYQIGEKVKVIVEETNLRDKRIEFSVVE